MMVIRRRRPDELLAAADRALLAVKAAGKDSALAAAYV